MKYEHMSILKGTLTEDEVKKEMNNFKTFFEKNNITVDIEENLGLRRLAYEIRKNKEGYYLRYELETAKEKISEIEKFTRENENVIKFITVRLNDMD